MPAFDPTTTAIVIVGLMAGVLGLCGFLTLSERKISAWMQDRLGPNRVGPFGMLQPLADGGKFFLKEEVIPSHVDKIFYVMAPAVAVATALFALAVVPFGPTVPAPDPVPVTAGAVATFEQRQADYQQQTNFVLAPGLDVGVLYLFAVGSLAVYGVVLAGWSANNKYSLLGALRASAQIISYEIPLGMAVLGVFLIVGSLNPEKVVAWQTANGVWWLVLFQPLALLLFMTAQYAEANRLPFDLPEAEQELVGGYHTEYSALKLGLMLLSEYVHLVGGSLMLVALFLGGWSLFGLENLVTHPVWAAVVKTLIFCGKMFALVIFAQFVRWTIPRFRFDQLMNIAWKVMIPLALLNLLCVMVVKQFGLPLGVRTATSLLLFLGAGVVSVSYRGSVTNPKRKVVKLPPGVPAGVTYSS